MAGVIGYLGCLGVLLSSWLAFKNLEGGMSETMVEGSRLSKEMASVSLVSNITLLIMGIFFTALFYFFFRKPKSEKITIWSNQFSYDSGTKSPWALLFNSKYEVSELNVMKKMFSRKIYKDLPRESLVFKPDSCRLYFDDGALRVFIGSDLSEPETEWLYEKVKPT